MNTFRTQINGVPCICRVTHYKRGIPGCFMPNWEDSVEAVPSEFEFEILDLNYQPNYQLCFDKADEERLQDEFEAFILAEKYGKEF